MKNNDVNIICIHFNVDIIMNAYKHQSGGKLLAKLCKIFLHMSRNIEKQSSSQREISAYRGNEREIRHHLEIFHFIKYGPR